ncbi:MAG TPA: AAA family ATPase [Candidatus Saccharimonadales bacterium]|nr:AAA family ATPase [Candidatus Saccharimonadales bacterium]
MGQGAVNLQLPAGALILLIGPSGSGKSTFAARHFLPSEVLSSDAMRGMVPDDPNDQTATEAAFELLHAALALRLARGRLTVVDATNVERWARERLLAVARRHGRPASAIVLDLPLEVCLERNAARRDRQVPAAAVRRQQAAMRASVGGLEGEGFELIWRFSSAEAVSGATVERTVGKA